MSRLFACIIINAAKHALLFGHVILLHMYSTSHLFIQNVIKPSCNAYKEATGKECVVQITENFLPDEW